MTWYHITARHYRRDGMYTTVRMGVEAPDLQSAVMRFESYAIGWKIGVGGPCIFEGMEAALGPLPSKPEGLEAFARGD